ncbi:MAG: hypothetical protein KDH94_05210, partial [Coxiellaceae bacterium]|nr:hypothetical protein [Coxiellaceae bacterium]
LVLTAGPTDAHIQHIEQRRQFGRDLTSSKLAQVMQHDDAEHDSYHIDQLYQRFMMSAVHFKNNFEVGNQQLSEIDKVKAFLQKLLENDQYDKYLEQIVTHAHMAETIKKFVSDTQKQVSAISGIQAKADIANRAGYRHNLVVAVQAKNNKPTLCTLHCLRAGNSHAKLISDILSDDKARGNLDMQTIDHFKRIAPGVTEEALHKHSALCDRYFAWCVERKQCFSLTDRVEHLERNPSLWQTQFAKKLIGTSLRESLRPSDLYRLLISPMRASHLSAIVKDDLMCRQLEKLSWSLIVEIAIKNNIDITKEESRYEVINRIINNNASDEDFRRYVKHALENQFSGYDLAIKAERVAHLFSLCYSKQVNVPRVVVWREMLLTHIVADARVLIDHILREKHQKPEFDHFIQLSQGDANQGQYIEIFAQLLDRDPSMGNGRVPLASLNEQTQKTVIDFAAQRLLTHAGLAKGLFINHARCGDQLTGFFVNPDSCNQLADQMLQDKEFLLAFFNLYNTTYVDMFFTHLDVQRAHLLYIKLYAMFADIEATIGRVDYSDHRQWISAVENRVKILERQQAMTQSQLKVHHKGIAVIIDWIKSILFKIKLFFSSPEARLKLQEQDLDVTQRFHTLTQELQQAELQLKTLEEQYGRERASVGVAMPTPRDKTLRDQAKVLLQQLERHVAVDMNSEHSLTDKQ